MLRLVVIAGVCSAVQWEVLKGVNLCGSSCGCEGTNCKDTKNFHFVGKLDNFTACQDTCENDPAGKCKVWLWSGGSHHCWWRLDNQWTIMQSQTNVISGCSSDVPNCALAAPTPAPTPVIPTPPPSPFAPSTADNMNGEYVLSSTPKGDASKFPTHYKDYPGGVEMFEVYSPMVTSRYSQVFWKGLEPVPLPEDIVQKFEGKGMAVVGFELDQVRRTPDGDVSVPINIAYNHHFESNMVGKKSKLEKIKLTGPDDPRIKKHKLDMGHGIGHDEAYIVHDLLPGNPIPTSQSFGGANGGEVRKSFHGYAPGFAQVIESPTEFQITPMQIDTWNRDKMNLTGSPFVQGPEPRNSMAPKDSIYSGLLECPVTTRITKLIDGGYSTHVNGTCPTTGGAGPIGTSTECFEAAASTFAGANLSTSTGSNASKPAGCSASIDPSSGVVMVFYNSNSAAVSAQCGAGAATKSVAASTASLVHVSVELDVANQEATITLVGPDAVWFGVGFGAVQMKDTPWAVIVEGGGKVSERKLADQSPGSALATSVTVKSTSVVAGERTLVLTRPMKGATKDHYTFDASTYNLNFINAVGAGPTLAYHKSKTPDSLAFLPTSGAGACLCAGKAVPFGDGSGYLQYHPVAAQAGENGTFGKVSFANKCAPQPRTDLLAQQNPTCDVRTYVGGQTACHHMWSLLDADQEIPWADQLLEYQLKFRFWIQEYNETYHTTVQRSTWGIASPVEYDVPKCAEGIMGCSKAADGSWVHTITGTYKGSGKLVAAHFHCHAPTCLSIAMYRNDTGELLCEERPVYGSTDRSPDAVMSEPGFILQPPCLWGDAKFGLQEPPDVNGVTLHSVKTSNATYGHHGEMAWQQMYLI